MTPKQTALINVAKMVGLAILAGAVTSLLLMHVPLPYLGIGACVIVLLYLVHMIYELELSKAEHLDALNTLNKMK
jgi:hydrogenase/urease accessory protein HupE